MALHVRKGDTVIVTCGNNKGKQGKIMRVFPDRNTVLVEGINLRKKHLRPTQGNQQGGIVEKEMPIHISNVSPATENKPSRVRFNTNADGKKVRLSARSGEQIGPELKK